MIPLNRVPMPTDLQTKCEQKVSELMQLLSSGQAIKKSLLDFYRDPEVKRHLVQEANGKCAYCESKISHVYYGDVEHIRPKSRFPAERLSPENLTLVCAICNGSKSDYWDDDLSVLNPFKDNPSDHLFAFGFLLLRRPGAERGRITISQLDLNRVNLLERRRERVELLQSLADQYKQATSESLRKVIELELSVHVREDSEYAMFVRSYLCQAIGLEFDEASKSFVPLANQSTSGSR